MGTIKSEPTLKLRLGLAVRTAARSSMAVLTVALQAPTATSVSTRTSSLRIGRQCRASPAVTIWLAVAGVEVPLTVSSMVFYENSCENI